MAVTPDDPSALVTAGTILGAMERREEALACYRKALAYTPATDQQGRSRILSGLGIRLNALERYEEAEAAYAEAVASEPGYAYAWFNRANNEGKWAEAIVDAVVKG